VAAVSYYGILEPEVPHLVTVAVLDNCSCRCKENYQDIDGDMAGRGDWAESAEICQDNEVRLLNSYRLDQDRRQKKSGTAYRRISFSSCHTCFMNLNVTVVLLYVVTM